MMNDEIPDLSQLSVADDAFTYLKNLPPYKRRPNYGMNNLPKATDSYSDEEQALVIASFSPKARTKKPPQK